MRRRPLLAGVVSVVSGTALAGRLSSGASVAQESTTAEVPADPGDPIARATLGSGSASTDRVAHRVRLWNLADRRQSVGLEIDSERAGFDGGYDLDPDAHVVVLIRDRDAYEVTVTVDDATVGSTALEAASFDEPCPATELFVLEDGGFESTFEPESDHCED